MPGARKLEAELIASELLLGPKSTSFSSAFAPGVRVESAMYRKGRLFVDISADAALADPRIRLRTGSRPWNAASGRLCPGLKRLS